MDRYTAYAGQLPRVSDFLRAQRAAMIGIGTLARAVLGDSPVADGLACAPTAPASLTVLVAPGILSCLAPVDSSAWSALAADPTSAIVKLGINLAAVPLTVTAPPTAGTSLAYMVEGSFLEEDVDGQTVSYFNAANPSVPLSGPAGGGAAQNTRRTQRVALRLKAGIVAATGSQVPPTADAGWVPLWVITVAAGQTQIQGGDITVAAGAPFLPTKLPGAAGAASLAGYATVGALATEAAARTKNVSDLSGWITAEGTARTAADTQLSTAIAKIRQGRPSLVSWQTSGTYIWTVPADVPPGTSAEVTCQGAGGGSAGCTSGTGSGTVGGGGGGAGGYGTAFLTINPGDQIQITVGAGGAPCGAGAQAGAGGTSSVGTVISCTGGVGGASYATPAGGQGGQAYGSALGTVGGDGGDGTVGNTMGGSGGASFWGGGGRAGNGGGQRGRAFGSGAGGGYGGGSGVTGAVGSDGLITIRF